MTRTDILNQIIARCGYTTYLEIGVQRGVNFQAIQCQTKVGVDPEPLYAPEENEVIRNLTSDAFFFMVLNRKSLIGKSKQSFDLIFIDGLHHDDQALRDFNNALKVLSPQGTIVLHDCNPPNEPCQRVPRETSEWCGDVWKAWGSIAAQNLADQAAFCIDTDYGVGVYSRHPHFDSQCRASLLHLQMATEGLQYKAWDYDFLAENRTELLNLITPEEFTKIIQS